MNKGKFKVGDRVRRIEYENTEHVPVGSTGTVRGADEFFVDVKWDHCDTGFGNLECYLEKIEEAKVPEVKIKVSQYGQAVPYTPEAVPDFVSGFQIKDSGERKEFASGMVRDTGNGKVRYNRVLSGPMFKRWAEHLHKGAVKYPDVAPGVANWTLASGEEELQRAKESALGHMIDWLDGKTDEDHAAAVFFNINLAEYTKGRIAQVN
ncbi:MAG: hypothetical protein KGH87_09120 [Thaumarchaeota archaeon]|nr:hypothetical protein [Nitrososphaerota archaeon]MDE1840065.1 hypothetical protein [Nitrososphaerota archaeon]